MTTPAINIPDALAKLDVANDNHWTADGLPRLETVRMLAGDQSITRDAVTAAAQGFSRATAAQGVVSAPVEGVTSSTGSHIPSGTEPKTEGDGAHGVQGASTTPSVPPVPVTSSPGLPPQGTAQTTVSDTLPNFAQVANPNPLANIASTDNSELLETLRNQRQAVANKLEDIQRVEAEIKKQKLALQEKYDDLNIQVTKLEPQNSNQQDIQTYLKSQQKILQRRAEQIGAVKGIEKELGFKLQDVLPKRSPIDSAMARKSGYGKNRPT